MWPKLGITGIMDMSTALESHKTEFNSHLHLLAVRPRVCNLTIGVLFSYIKWGCDSYFQSSNEIICVNCLANKY